MNRNGVLGSNTSHIPGNRISNSFIDSLDLKLGLLEALEIKYEEKISKKFTCSGVMPHKKRSTSEVG